MHETLARDRSRYERLVLSRMGRTITSEDAEDIVSEALIKVQAREHAEPPQRGKEDAWFARIVLNQGIDFLRARDGRRRNGSTGRPTLVSVGDFDEEAASLGAALGDEPLDLENLGEQAEREHVRDLVQRVMEALDPKDAELVKLRHLVGATATREEVASMAGMTVGEFRWRYARAWGRFVDAVALDAPTDRCRRVRQLLGEVEAGTAPMEAASEIDAHTLDCASCRVFARESYRALELLPFVPVVGFTERWATKIGWWWDRSGPETTTGAGTATGAGLWALLGGGGAAIKAVALVCSATAVPAGLCAGVIAVLDDLGRTPPPAKAAKPKRPIAATPTPTPIPTPAATPAVKKRSASRPQKKTTTADTSGEKQIPAPAPEGASEFNPSASSANADPAPAPPAGGGEFTP